jgi:hypothetical protein
MKLVRCSYPSCVLEEHLEGEHKVGRPLKPWGTLRQLQRFEGTLTGGVFRCEMCSPFLGVSMHIAVAFYADMLGFGWALCAECAGKFTTEVAKPAKEEKPVLAGPATSSAFFASSAVEAVAAGPAKILKFARRNA